MPPSDQEPRYQLVDSNDNVVGSLFGDGSGNVVIADETDTQTTFGPNGISTPALEADGAVIGDTYRFASRYDGADADARLDNALSAANNGDTIYLENASYTESRTISTRLTIIGSQFRIGSEIENTWTLAETLVIKNVRPSSGSVIQIDSDSVVFSEFNGFTDINVTASNVVISSGVWVGNITLTSSSSGCVVDAVSGGATVTDNGTGNVIGDLS